MRLAVIADVHGNLVALEAVLAHLRETAPDLLVNLGDLVSGPFDPAGSADAQMALACPTLAGNHERQVLEGGAGSSDAIARSLLSASHLDWLGTLPGTLSLVDGQVFACYGSPQGGDLEYVLEDVSTGRARLDVELRAVPYDYEAAAQQAERHGRAQTAHVVRTGWMRSA